MIRPHGKHSFAVVIDGKVRAVKATKDAAQAFERALIVQTVKPGLVRLPPAPAAQRKQPASECLHNEMPIAKMRVGSWFRSRSGGLYRLESRGKVLWVRDEHGASSSFGLSACGTKVLPPKAAKPTQPAKPPRRAVDERRRARLERIVARAPKRTTLPQTHPANDTIKKAFLIEKAPRPANDTRTEVVLRERDPNPANDTKRPAFIEEEKKFTGSRYESTKEFSTAQIAKLIRADIKREVGRSLPKGLKTSVTSGGSSVHSSIDITIKAAPEVQLYERHPGGTASYSAAGKQLMQQLETIAEAYQRSRTHSQSDYYNMRFYLSVLIDSKLW
jgi:hypothetical protein